MITFDASASSPGSGRIISSYRWDFGDGTSEATGKTTTHAYVVAGSYIVSLMVTNDCGKSDFFDKVISVGVIPTPTPSSTPTPTPTPSFYVMIDNVPGIGAIIYVDDVERM